MKSEKFKILHIEDDAASRLMVRRILEEEPFIYYEAENGIGGLKAVEEVKPDLILMDIHLPDISGVELTTKIKSQACARNTIVVALTGMTDPGTREEILVAGCDGYITKPLNVSEFPGQLRQYLKGKREVVEEGRRESVRRRYEQRLVEKLTQKLQELQHSNSRLKESTTLLREYNEKLEVLVRIINRLQSCQTLQQLRRKLVEEIALHLQFERCIFLQPDFETMSLNISAAHGLPEDQWEKIRLPYQPNLLKKLFRNKPLLHVESPLKVEAGPFRAGLEKLRVAEFFFGIVGIPPKKAGPVIDLESARAILRPLVPSLHDQEFLDIDVIHDHLKDYLASEFFYLGGYIFIDRRKSANELRSFEVRLLETLLRSASLYYQNLQLSEQLKFLFIHAEKDAITDHLTDLFNYRYFIQHLEMEIYRARRHNSHFALLMLDIDFFKNYNDTLGHQAGDLVLKNLAKLLQKNTRSSDIVARYGGEEFVIICPELSKNEGKILAEKLRLIVANSPFPNQKEMPDASITISVGVAAFPEDTSQGADLIRKADLALYKAKNSGRNQVCTFSPDDMVPL